MKLFFDQNLSPRLVARLADPYPDSNPVYPLGLDRVPDHEVYEYARSEGFLLVTILEDAPTTGVPETALLSEQALAKDWDRPEEDEAWSHLQPER